MLNQARVKEFFSYQDGNLIRLTSPRRRIKVGDIAGSLGSKGYLQTRVEGKRYLNHRLIWLWHYGYFPERDLDHIDRDRTNNRIGNLREVSRRCNMRNTGNPANNTSGVKGVVWHKSRNKWEARTKINRRNIHLGYHTDFTEAVCHRLAAEQSLNWHGCDSSSPALKYMQEYLRTLKVK